MQDIKGTLLNLTKSVTKTSGDLLKSTKLSMNLSSEEGNLKGLYLEIGKKVHEIYQYGGSLGKFFDEKFLEIEACERKICELKEQISVIKGTKNCPKCGKSVERTADFCQKCGIRVELGLAGHGLPASHETSSLNTQEQNTVTQPEVLPHITESMEIPHTPEPVLRSCRVCNYKNENTTKFCLSCGRIMD